MKEHEDGLSGSPMWHLVGCDGNVKTPPSGLGEERRSKIVYERKKHAKKTKPKKPKTFFFVKNLKDVFLQTNHRLIVIFAGKKCSLSLSLFLSHVDLQISRKADEFLLFSSQMFKPNLQRLKGLAS